jgi:predicted RNA-binding protein YlqC (UPF0109 family)
LPEPSQLESLITYIAKSLVDRPEKVELKLSNAEGGLTYELEVAPEDVGKVIGRDGRTVNAMRTLLSAAAQRKGEKARLEIIDDRRGAMPAGSPSGPPDGSQAGDQ